MPAGLKDIARRANVSHVTVSNVLNRHGMEGEVSARTAERIRRLAAKMNYVPNLAARNLRTGKTQTVVLATRCALRYAYVHEVIEEIHFLLTPHGYRLNLELLHRVKDEESIFRTFRSDRCDGVILLDPPLNLESVTKIKESGMPLVTIGPQVHPKVDSVTWNRVTGTRIGTEHLLGLGHRHVAFVLHEESSLQNSLLKSGHQSAHKHLGLPWNPELVMSWKVGTNPEELWARLIKLHPRPTALLSYNLELAAAFLRSIRKYKVRVPKELALVTLGEAEINDLVEVPITAVDCAYRKIAALVVERLLRQIQDPNASANTILVEPTLIVRESSGGSIS